MNNFLSPQNIQSMANDDFWIGFCVLAVLGLGGVISIFINLKKARIIEDTPTSKLRSAAQGYVEVIGMAEPLEDTHIIGPLTQTQCLWYRFEVEEYRSNGKNSSWHTIEKGTSSDYFQLNDQTGTCVIDPKGADVHASKKDRWRGSSRRPLGKSSTNSFFQMGRYRYTEERLHTYDPLYTLGNMETMGGSRTAITTKSLSRDVVNEWKQDYQALLDKYDTNGDGELDLEEWKQVQQAARLEADKRKQEIQAAPEVNIMTKPPTRGYPYLISTKGQDELSKRYRWISFASLIIGLPCSVLAAWMITARMM